MKAKFHLNIKSALLLISIVFIILIINSCTINDSPESGGMHPAASIAVFSDPHYFDPALGTTGEVFQTQVAGDRKLIAESEAILEAVISEIISQSADVVLIPGDLTKDGELASHQKFAQYLGQIEASGAKVYVVPGNHDINNPNSYSYLGEASTPVANVSPAEFENIYYEFGYGEALERDANSLSYVAEPVENLWLIGMDPCIYDENIGRSHSVTSGEFNSETYNWIKSKIEEGVSSGKTVFGMMHHGLTEHFLGQKAIFSPYVIENYETVRSEFASLGMKIVFTGHFHANDIVKYQSGDSFVFDVETGSTVTWPCPYRFLQLDAEETLTIATNYITDINYDTGSLSFPDYAQNFITDGLPSLIIELLEDNFEIVLNDAEQLAPVLTQAVIAHYAGDEFLSAETMDLIQQFISNPDPQVQFFGTGLMAIYTDPDPADNNITIDLSMGVAY
ncbi:metallophosphoesterase family protein [Bacteroidota bacterium]